MTSLLNKLDNGFNIQGLDRPEVDDLSLDTVLLLKLLSSDERLADATGESNYGEVLAGAFDLSLAELEGVSYVYTGVERVWGRIQE